MLDYAVVSLRRRPNQETDLGQSRRKAYINNKLFLIDLSWGESSYC